MLSERNVIVPPNRYRTGYVATAEDGANIAFASNIKRQRWTLHYRPSPTANDIATRVDDTFKPLSAPLLLVEGDVKADLLVIHPLNITAGSRGFLQSKYDTLRTVTFEGFGFSIPHDLDDAVEVLRGLPSGFVQDPYFGLGVNWDLRYLTDAIEEFGVTDLRIRTGSRTGLPAVTGGSYVLSRTIFDDARRAINRAHDRALRIAASEKRAYAHNTLLTAVDRGPIPSKAGFTARTPSSKRSAKAWSAGFSR